MGSTEMGSKADQTLCAEERDPLDPTVTRKKKEKTSRIKKKNEEKVFFSPG